MANNRYARAPRRPIERVWSQLAHVVSDSITTKTLHTCTEAETLVRMRVDVGCRKTDTGTEECLVTVAVAPAATPVGAINPQLAEDLDNAAPDELLLQHEFLGGIDATVYEWVADTKAMRKLKPGDTIQWKDIADFATKFSMGGFVTMWFKK